MKTYEIYNPSDPYTLKSEDYMTAAVAVAFLGGGAYGIEGTPMLFGWDNFFEKHGIDLDEFMKANAQDVADVLKTVLIGTESQRAFVEAELENMPDGEKETYLKRRHDKLRTSIRDIGRSAASLVKGLEDKLKQKSVCVKIRV